MNSPACASGDGPPRPRTAPADSAPCDRELVLAARGGDKRAFVGIVARHQAMVCGIALGILGDFAASEDAAQEAFLAAWRGLEELRDPAQLRAWLARIARNAALGQLRGRRGHGALDEAGAVPDPAPTPDEIAVKRDELELVRKSLATLPETYRLPLVLYYREGRSVCAVAETLGINEEAAKQRLVRGRELLRDRMSSLVEGVLTRTGPTSVFTMTVAAALGALAAPSAVAGSAFAAASAAASASPGQAASSLPWLTAMSASKVSLFTALLVGVLCVPVGYQLARARPAAARIQPAGRAETGAPTAPRQPPAGFDNRGLYAEWRALHDRHGTNAAAMSVLHAAIAELADPFRRRAFHTALIAEWVQVDARGGLAFFLAKGREERQRRQFIQEWLAFDARGAVEALLNGGPATEELAREALPEIARRAPARVPEVAAQVKAPEDLWDTAVRDAFALVAQGNLAAARLAAEALSGPNRREALAGVGQAWAKSDFDGALAWAKNLAQGPDRDEIIRAILLGKAAIEPATALELVGLVPAGGRAAYMNSTTGARVLTEAAKTDFDATVAWLGAHPGRLGREELLGLAAAVTDRLNANPAAFLNTYAAAASLEPLVPAIESALLNSAAGQRAAVWEWLTTQPDTETTKSLRQTVLRSAGYQDPGLALRLAADLPVTPAGDAARRDVAEAVFNGGRALHRFDALYAQAPERLRPPLMAAAFESLRADTLEDPPRWIARLQQLPAQARPRGVESIARAWAGQAPEEAIDWAAALSPGEAREGAVAAIVAAWGAKDAHGATQWVTTLPAGLERDRAAASLVPALTQQFPREAWEWALSIQDAEARDRAALQAVKAIAARDPATASRWVEAADLPPELQTRLRSALESPGRSPASP